MDLSSLRKSILNYPKTLAQLKELRLRLQETAENLGVSAVNYDNDIKKSGISNATEAQALKLIEDKQEIQKQIRKKIIDAERIENALTVLNDKEEIVIRLLLIEKKNIYMVADQVERDKTTVRRIEKKALNKMLDLINLKGN